MSAIHFWGTQPWRHESIICWLNFLALTCKWSIHNCMWRQNEYTQHTSWSFRVTFSSNALTTVTLSFLTLSNSFERFSTSCDSISFCWRSNDISWDSSCSLSLTEASWPTKLSILVCSSLLAEDVRSSRSERFSHSEVNRVTSAWRCDNNRSSSVRSAPGISGGGCSSWDSREDIVLQCSYLLNKCGSKGLFTWPPCLGNRMCIGCVYSTDSTTVSPEHYFHGQQARNNCKPNLMHIEPIHIAMWIELISMGSHVTLSKMATEILSFYC